MANAKLLSKGNKLHLDAFQYDVIKDDNVADIGKSLAENATSNGDGYAFSSINLAMGGVKEPLT